MRDIPKPETLFQWGTQPRKLYEALMTEGEITNKRITSRLHVRYYGEVIEQIRAAIAPFGLDVVRRRLSACTWTYRLAVAGRMFLDSPDQRRGNN